MMSNIGDFTEDVRTYISCLSGSCSEEGMFSEGALPNPLYGHPYFWHTRSDVCQKVGPEDTAVSLARPYQYKTHYGPLFKTLVGVIRAILV